FREAEAQSHGNHGRGFQCGHEHDTGDRCLSSHFTPDCWEEVVASVPGVRKAEFERPSLPPSTASWGNGRPRGGPGAGPFRIRGGCTDLAAFALRQSSGCGTPPDRGDRPVSHAAATACRNRSISWRSVAVF